MFLRKMIVCVMVRECELFDEVEILSSRCVEMDFWMLEKRVTYEYLSNNVENDFLV